jgi:hypothetical protein
MPKVVDFRILLSSALLIACVSCGGGEKQIQGSVFIITQGADNIKLGLVKVSAIPEGEITKFVDDKKAAVGEATTRLRSDADALRPNIEKCQSELADAGRAYDGAKTQIDALKSREEALSLEYNPYGLSDINPYNDEVQSPEQIAEIAKQRRLGNQLTAVRKQIANSEGRLAKLDTARNDAEKRLNDQKAQWTAVQLKMVSFINAAFLLDGVPEGKVKTVTDADGKFNMNLPTGKYALVASSQRRVGTTTEDYSWLVWVDVNSDGAKQITLSNQNMLGEDSEESIFKVKELLPSSDDSPNKTANVNFKV